MFRLLLAVLSLWPGLALAQDCSPDALRDDLLQRNETDQAARRALLADRESKEALERALDVDRENTRYMRTVVANCGWPKRSEVGEQAAKAAWRLTQHADMDPQYQALAAQQLELAVHRGEAEARDLALLVDRNRRLNDQPQVYGMQFQVLPGDVIRFYDIVNSSQLDERRAEIGLPSFYCWAQQIASNNEGASIEWPGGILFAPRDCTDAP
ncbi:DUF6624 domain-containing protein [Luteimonas sp. A649]